MRLPRCEASYSCPSIAILSLKHVYYDQKRINAVDLDATSLGPAPCTMLDRRNSQSDGNSSEILAMLVRCLTPCPQTESLANSLLKRAQLLEVQKKFESLATASGWCTTSTAPCKTLGVNLEPNSSISCRLAHSRKLPCKDVRTYGLMAH